jgi:predicted RNase H-like HicB family nuclease
MLTNSRDIKRRLEREGWILERVATSSSTRGRELLSFYLTRRKTWVAASFVISIGRLVGSPIDRAMTHYVAIVEDAGPEKAIGIWFPDLPGCFSAGDDIDEAMRNAHEALALYADAEAREGRILPKPRAISALKADPAIVPDLQGHMVALVELDAQAVHAAE